MVNNKLFIQANIKKKAFGKFDLIIYSSKLRAFQTAEIISKEIDYDKHII
jgi:phosphohistidine phosphatase SixA